MPAGEERRPRRAASPAPRRSPEGRSDGGELLALLDEAALPGAALLGEDPLSAERRVPPEAAPDQIRQHRASAHYLESLRASAPANALKVLVPTAALKSSYAELAKLRQRVADAARANKPEAGYVEGAKPPAGAATAAVPQGQDYETAKNPFLK